MVAPKFEARLMDCAFATQNVLDEALMRLPSGRIRDGMTYACRGGKKLRAFLVIEGARLHGVSTGFSLPVAAAVEAFHAYSLVHDDLPSMDNDRMRRGQPTVHVKWDEASAILVGDALQSLAFDLITDSAATDDVKMQLIAGLARAGGAAGMVLGQDQDIAAETAETPLSLDQITRLQALKTGALIEWSGTAGAILAGKDPSALRNYSTALGLAFQIADDILDVTGDPNKTGKAVGKDAAAGKATFVSLMGLDGARARASELVTLAESAIAGYGDDAECLRQAARFVISRDS